MIFKPNIHISVCGQLIDRLFKYSKYIHTELTTSSMASLRAVSARTATRGTMVVTAFSELMAGIHCATKERMASTQTGTLSFTLYRVRTFFFVLFSIIPEDHNQIKTTNVNKTNLSRNDTKTDHE